MVDFCNTYVKENGIGEILVVLFACQPPPTDKTDKDTIEKRVETSVNQGCNQKMVKKVTFAAIMYWFPPFFLCNKK